MYRLRGFQSERKSLCEAPRKKEEGWGGWGVLLATPRTTRFCLSEKLTQGFQFADVWALLTAETANPNPHGFPARPTPRLSPPFFFTCLSFSLVSTLKTRFSHRVFVFVLCLLISCLCYVSKQPLSLANEGSHVLFWSFRREDPHCFINLPSRTIF